MWTNPGFAQVLGRQVLRRGVVAGLVQAIVCFSAGAASAEGPLKLAGSQLEPVKWSELTGWPADDHLAAFAAYQAGCRALRKTPRTDDGREIHGALANLCRKAIALRPRDGQAARAFFEQNFQPIRIARLGETEGLLTGYFEPVVAGSRFPNPEFPIPLYRRPRDLVAAGVKPGSAAFPNKGVRIGRRTGNNNELVPYHDRGAIEAGALDGQKLEICWLKDPSDLLAIQIEGSGRVILEDGTPLRVTYDSHNGYNYSSFERVLVERNFMSRKEMSRERIRAWMAAYPEEAAKVRATNRAYAFFRVTGLTNEGEPVGAQGVPLTPGRSIAVDQLHEYGTPFFIEASLPIGSVKPASPFRRLMIAQDTGSAIVGPARADLYFGAGDDAGRIAGRIHHRGRFAMLLPRDLDMVAAGTKMPLPVPKPKIAAVEVAKQDGKRGKPSKADPAGARAVTDGRSMPVPAPKPKLATLEAKTKIAALEAKKQDGKGRVESAGARAATDGRSMPVPKPKLAAIEVKKRDGKGKADPAGARAATDGRSMPLPAPKPKLAALEAKKQDGKGRVELANSGASASGKQMPLPVLKPKATAIEVKKQDGKSKGESASVRQIAAGGKREPPPSPKSKTSGIEVKKQNGKGKLEAARAGDVPSR